MNKLDVRLNLLATKFYFLLGMLIGKSKSLPPKESVEFLTILELMKEEIDKFLDSFREKEKGGENL